MTPGRGRNHSKHTTGGAHRRAPHFVITDWRASWPPKRGAIMPITIRKGAAKPVRISEVLEMIEARRSHNEEVTASNAAASKPVPRRNRQIAKVNPAPSEPTLLP